MRPVNAAAALLSLVLLGCSSPSEPDKAPAATDSATQTEVEVASSAVQFASLARAFQALATTAGDTMLAACRPLTDTVQAFSDNPEERLQDEAREVWHACYASWQAFSLFHQVAFSPAEQQTLDRSRRLINVRPFLPGYVDALPDYPYSGLVHETGMTLSLDNLLEQHQLMDLESPALGFPVVETLLWQADLDTYWLTSGGDSDQTITRRHEYLTLATGHLLRQLENAHQRWGEQAALAGLPAPAQRRVVLTSLDRQIRHDLLELAFTMEAPREPDWHHPSLVAGQGKRHLRARLAGLEALLEGPDDGVNAFESWLERRGGPITADSLNERLTRVTEALNALPDNAPAGNPDPETWQQAVAAMTALADQVSALSTQNGQ